MLKSLRIENYALIRSEFIEFSDGFSVICGQTGAGKSIIMQALGLALGERADLGALADKERKCVSEAVFLLEESYRKAFEDLDLDYEKENVFRREILPSGKSRAFVNDTPVQLSAMKQLSQQIIDIHSQHDTLQLHDKDFRFAILDAYSQKPETLKEYNDSYTQYVALRKELSEVSQRLTELKKENDYTQHLYDELESAKLKSGEQEDLEQSVELMSAGEEIQTQISSSLLLFDSEDYPCVLNNLLQVQNLLSKVSSHSPELESLSQRTESALIELRDVYAELQRFGERLDFDPEVLQQQQERLSMIYDLQRKHSAQSVDELLNLQQELSQSLEDVGSLQERKAELEHQMAELETHLGALVSEVFNQRKSSAKEIEQSLLPLLSSMGMAKSALRIELSKEEDFTSDASCRVEFLFSSDTSAKNGFRAVEKVASGGELSRLMLALKCLESRKRRLGTMIFDEIDSGISGEVASRVAGIMLQIAQSSQVISISHLAQTAAKAQRQYKVFKTETSSGSESAIVLLSQEERIEEIARLLSDGKPSQAALANAQELLQGGNSGVRSGVM